MGFKHQNFAKEDIDGKYVYKNMFKVIKYYY